jgi:hypothetical protein
MPAPLAAAGKFLPSVEDVRDTISSGVAQTLWPTGDAERTT